MISDSKNKPLTRAEASNLWLGALAALAAALIGSGWQLGSRYGVTTTLGSMELATLRYGVPALVLLPVLFKIGLFPAALSKSKLALLVLSGGLPFGLVVLAGAQWAPASHIGVFLSGSLPLFTALAALVFLGDKVSRVRWLGLALIFVGLLVFGLAALANLAATWRGDILFLLAAIMWAAHTLAFRASGLTPWQGAALINFWSSLMLIPILLTVGAPKLLTAPWQDIAVQALGQGIVAGLIGMAVYMAAVARLGAARGSLSAALVPLFTGVGGAWLLNEPLSAGAMLAIGLVMAGVALAADVFQRRP